MTRAQHRVADLVRRARDPRAPLWHRHAAFTVLVEGFQGMAFATALRASDEAEDARDACQDAFMVAWQMLADLREPAAFGGWLTRLVRTQCARRRRRRAVETTLAERARHAADESANDRDPAEVASRHETEALIRRAVRGLPAEERRVVSQFYFLGASLRTIARMLGISVAAAGKRLYSARLRLRRRLPRSLAEAFLGGGPTGSFTREVEAGVFDELVGEYRFAKRPDHPVAVRREGHTLVSYAGGQRNVLASRGQDRLIPVEFDGEARFQRNRGGQVSHFIYYEFGRRLGIARKVR